MREINLVCMSGQGSVQAVELLAKAYYYQHGQFVVSKVFPGVRSKSAPVVSYLKVDDRPILSTSANYNPNEVIVFWDGLFNIAEKNGHPIVADAIGRLRSGLFLVNSTLRPDELNIPFSFSGTVATVDADGLVKKFLRRNPPPVGLCLLGAYATVTRNLDLAQLEELVMERFPNKVGRQNVDSLRGAAEAVQIMQGFNSGKVQVTPELEPVDPDAMPEWHPIQKDTMRGISEGGPAIFRTHIPVCEDTKCLCHGTCISEVICPDNTGFIVREGLGSQGYRIDTDYCRGCALCVEVCVFGALRMVSEREVVKDNPTYEGISVAPFLKTSARKRS